MPQYVTLLSSSGKNIFLRFLRNFLIMISMKKPITNEKFMTIQLEVTCGGKISELVEKLFLPDVKHAKEISD